MFLAKIKVGSIFQFNKVNEDQLKLIKQLDHKDDGTCCGQTQCYACKMGGIRIKYIGHIKIDSDDTLIKFMNCGQIYSLDELLGFVLVED